MTAADTVRELLGAAGLPASDTEIEAYAAAYPEFRGRIAALYSSVEMRDLAPALRFRAAPPDPQGDWAS